MITIKCLFMSFRYQAEISDFVQKTSWKWTKYHKNNRHRQNTGTKIWLPMTQITIWLEKTWIYVTIGNRVAFNNEQCLYGLVINLRPDITKFKREYQLSDSWQIGQQISSAWTNDYLTTCSWFGTGTPNVRQRM